MRAAVVLCCLLAAVEPAGAEDTFEAKAAGAQQIVRLESLVWPLTAACDQGDDTSQRQCRRVRDTRAAELGGATLIVEGDPGAFSVGAWSPQKKSSALTLSACVRCAGLSVDGATWFVVGTRAGLAAPSLRGGKLEAGSLHDSARTFADASAAKAFAVGVANARIQLIVKVPAKPRTVVDGRNVLSLDVLGYRVSQPCDGGIVVSSPRSSPAEVDPQRCAGLAGAAGSAAPRLDQLTAAIIQNTMKPVLAAASECYAQHRKPGKGKLKLTVASDGSVTAYEQQGDFANTPTGKCIDVAVKQVAFPRSKRERTPISFPIKLP